MLLLFANAQFRISISFFKDCFYVFHSVVLVFNPGSTVDLRQVLICGPVCLMALISVTIYRL